MIYALYLVLGACCEMRDAQLIPLPWGPRFSPWAPASRFHLVSEGRASRYVWAWPRASLSCPRQAGRLCNGRINVDCDRRSANYGRVSWRARGLCNWDVKESMGGYCALSSVSIFGCGCWEFWLRQRQTEDVQWDKWGTSAGLRPARLNGKARLAATVAVFVFSSAYGNYIHMHKHSACQCWIWMW